MEETTQETTQPIEQVEVKKRPAFLTVLCILTFIGSGLSLLMYVLLVAAAGFIASYMESLGMGGMIGEESWKVIVVLIAAAASLYGAIMMWKLKKLGFYIYIAAQIIALALGFSVMGLIFTALFIILYFLNFKHME